MVTRRVVPLGESTSVSWMREIFTSSLMRKGEVERPLLYPSVMYRRSKKLYKKRYHRRSLAETAVSTVKRRFNHMLYSKKRKAQKNELRLKVLTYNLSIIARLPANFS